MLRTFFPPKQITFFSSFEVLPLTLRFDNTNTVPTTNITILFTLWLCVSGGTFGDWLWELRRPEPTLTVVRDQRGPLTWAFVFTFLYNYICVGAHCTVLYLCICIHISICLFVYFHPNFVRYRPILIF